MHRTLIAATTLVSAAALMSGAGLALANTRAAGPDIFRTEHFRIISTSAPTAKQSVIATGAFTAGGSEIIGQTHDKAYLYRGTFRITRHITHKSAPVPPKNCIVTETERGTYTLSDGTGRYKGLRGSGRFSLFITTILASPGNAQCGRMVAFQQIIYESGRVNR